MAEDSRGKRRAAASPTPPAEAPEAPAAPSAEVPVGAGALAAAEPLLSPELPATAVADDPFASLSTILSDTGPVAGQLGAMAPTFGNVLLSIGTGVARSQALLDAGLRETVDKLKATRIKVVTKVVQELDDDGLPLAAGPDLETEEVSLINYVSPTQHVWKNVRLSMDMSVSHVSAESGLTFRRDQTSVAGRGGSFWGFYGWFEGAGTHSGVEQTSRSEYEQTWSSGQVRLDAVMEARHTDKLPVGVEVEIGPKIYFTQGPLREAAVGRTVTRRQVDVTIQVQKANAAVNANVTLVVACAGLGYGFASGYSSTTNGEGRTVVTLTRDVPAGAPLVPATGTLSVRLGEISRTLDVTL